jgi:protein-S-isoprenylcysteine O-methyltransferase Ste14
MARAVVSTLALIIVAGGSFFVPAGSWSSPTMWGLLLFFAVYSVVGYLWLDPGLIEERTSIPRDTRADDVLLGGPAFLLLLPGTLIVCGFDARHGWSPPMPPALQWPALAVFAAGYCFSLWAAHTNRFFSTVVRIQHERGHHLVDTGPYAFVRHPGYAGPLIGHLALPIALGSLWGLVPAIVGGALLMLRADYEERRLAAELAGYADYMRRVRWRAFPGLW